MNRRAFLRVLGLGAATAIGVSAGVVDVEQLLWVPGRTTYFDLGAQGPPLVWLTPDWIPKEALRLLQKNLTFTQQINRGYDAAFVSEFVVDMRRPTRFLMDYGDLGRRRTALDAYERDALILDGGATA
jgi:hypothetical protein